MKIRRKTSKCTNCNHTLADFYNFCPVCGQENHSYRISFWQLVKDFFSNYFALDSKLSRTVKPFFVKPGELTLQYMNGKRASYANPVRLYLVISLFYFLILSNVGKEMISKSMEASYESVELSNTEKEELKKILEEDDFDMLNKLIANKTLPNQRSIDSSFWENVASVVNNDKLKELRKVEKKAISKLNNDSIRKEKSDSVPSLKDLRDRSPDAVADTIERKQKDDISLFGRNLIYWVDWNSLRKKSKDLNYSEKELLAEFSKESMNMFELHVLRQIIRFFRLGPEVMLGYAIKNLPIMMFVLLPIFAFLLAILYWRKRLFYIDHIIHSIHLHCFAYLIYGISLAATFFLISNDTLSGWISFGAFLWVSIYAYLSFKRVYKQSNWKTIVKFGLQGFLYSTLIQFAFVIELIISLLIY